MSMNFRYPNITGRTEREQIFQISSFLRQMVDQLNFSQSQSGSGQSTATNGKDGKDGKNGKDGVDGKIPQKGVDYWTPADVQEIVSQAVTGVLKEKTAILKELIPVGSPYASKVNVDPSVVLGFGTWEKVEDRFILAASENYPSGSTGGEATHILTVEEMPSHTHKLRGESGSVASGSSYSRFSGSGTSEFSSITETGGSQPHNNMPPYYAMYVWIRTA